MGIHTGSEASSSLALCKALAEVERRGNWQLSLIWQEKQILVFVNKDEELSHPDTDILCKK